MGKNDKQTSGEGQPQQKPKKPKWWLNRMKGHKPPLPNTHGDWPLSELLRAAHECALEVSWKNSVLKWVIPQNHMRYCLALKKELDSGTYKTGNYTIFTVKEPKERLIRSPLFRDRVVQRCMCNISVYDDLTRGNIYDNGACQSGRGTKFMLDRLKVHMWRHYRRHGRKGWCLSLDIHHFFDSIPHGPLKEMARKLIRNKTYANLVCEIIDTYPDPGLGLGSQLSQLLAIAYLSPLIDHVVKEKLHIEHYIRYSDDFRIIHEDKGVLLHAWKVIKNELEAMGLSLNAKSHIHRLDDGVVFMKWRFRYTETGGIEMRKIPKAVGRFRRYYKRCIRWKLEGRRTDEDLAKTMESWQAHMEMGNSNQTIMNMRKFAREQHAKASEHEMK